jgi:hypothetical protein
MRARVTVAFIVAPAIGAACGILVLAMVSRTHIGLLISPLMVASAVTVLFVVPAFLLSRARLPIPTWAYAFAGILVAAIAAVPMTFFLPLSLTLLSILAGAAAGLTFGLIMLPTSNNRWSGGESYGAANSPPNNRSSGRDA